MTGAVLCVLITFPAAVGTVFAEADGSADSAQRQRDRAKATSYYRQGAEYQREGRFVEAIAMMERALAFSEKAFDADHQNIGTLTYHLGRMCIARKDYAKAQKYLTRCLSIYEAKPDVDQALIGSVLASLGQTYLATNRHDKAAEFYSRSLPLVRARFPKEHPQTTLMLNDLAVAYEKLGRLKEAEALHRESLRIREDVLGKDHPNVLLTLHNLGHVCLNARKFDEALKVCEMFLQRNERGLGEKHTFLPDVLMWAGECHMQMHQFAEADEKLSRSLAVREARGDQTGPKVARILRCIAMIHLRWPGGDLAKAQRCAERRVAIQTAALGADDPETAGALCQLADVYRRQRKFSEAQTQLTRGIGILEAKLGKDHPEVAVELIRLGSLYLETDQPAKAEATCLRCLKCLEDRPGRNDSYVISAVFEQLAKIYIQLGDRTAADAHLSRAVSALEARYGRTDPRFADVLDRVGRAYYLLRMHAQSRQILQQSIEIRRATMGNEHPKVAATLQQLATTCMDEGNHVAAEPLFLESLRIARKVYGPEHRDVFICLHDLGQLYRFMGRYEEAEAMYRQAYQAAEKCFSTDPSHMAGVLDSWGRLCQQTRRYAQAEPMLKRSLELQQRLLGPRDRRVAWCMVHLAYVYGDTGRYAEAKPLCQRGLKIFEAARGKAHPEAQVTREALGRICIELGQNKEAEQLLRENLANSPDGGGQAYTRHCLAELVAGRGGWEEAADHFMLSRKACHGELIRYLPSLSPAEQMIFLQTREREGQIGALSFGLQFREHTKVAEASAEWALNGKAISTEFLSQRARLARQSGDPAAAELVNELTRVRDRLARSVIAPGREAGVSDFEQLSRRERELARKVGQLAHADYAENRWVTLAEVRKALPEGTFLIDVAKFPVRRFDSATTKAKDVWKPPHYAAWVIPPAGRGSVKLIDLGEAAAIDAAVAECRLLFEWTFEAIDSVGMEKAVRQAREETSKLAELIFKPLEQSVADAEALVISPDAGLWLFPWEALPVGEKQFLIEKKRISYVSAGRKVAAEPDETPGSGGVIFADPDYDFNPSSPDSGLLESALAKWIQSFVQDSEPQGLLAGSKVSRFPNGAEEAKSLEAALRRYLDTPPTLYTDRRALESTFKKVQSPQVLIVSTHGFFLADQDFDDMPLTEEGREIWAAINAWRALGPQRENVPRIANPLLRCGLALTGANRHAEAKGADDGVLTGLEILGTDLRGTELVVLNACETGVGAVRSGEGTAGLRHAFQLAGARTVIGTLWSVPTKESARLVGSLLDNLAKEQGKADALRNAQLELIRSLRKTEAAAHPGLWAGFTLTGDWR